MSAADVLKNRRTDEQEPIAFGATFVRSEAFKALFREGMALIESAAAYLDGAGREESRRLPRPAALAYTTESMRLTTRLMQVASWLLVQRAVAQGEITPAQVASERSRVGLTEQAAAVSPRRVRSPAGAAQGVDRPLAAAARPHDAPRRLGRTRRARFAHAREPRRHAAMADPLGLRPGRLTRHRASGRVGLGPMEKPRRAGVLSAWPQGSTAGL